MKVALVLLLATSVLSAIQQKTSSRHARIIGGDSAYAGQYPFAAALYISTSNSRFFCSGSLIGPEWIVTAAQCINEAVSVTIHLGSIRLEGEDNNRLILASSEHVVHPDFNAETLENDIGLIKLRMAVSYSDYIQRVYMAYGNLSDYTNLVAIGWGQTSDTVPELSNELKHVDLAAVSNDECKLVYGSQISENMVCVAGEYNQGTCTGDSGAALLHYDSNSRSVRHVGISSFISGNGCESTDPSGYTRTYSYKPWITEVTGIIS